MLLPSLQENLCNISCLWVLWFFLGFAILPSKRTRRIPEVKKPSLADEALSELKAEQPEIKEENLDTEEAPLELSEEVPAEENKSE